MVLDPAELAELQADLVAAACDKTCVIQRKTRTPDGLGTYTEAWATIKTTVAGMQQPNAGLLSNYSYKIASLNAWHILLPYGTDVREFDRLVIQGQTLDVHVLLDPHSIPGFTPVLAAEVK